jgi:hypothetical protein
MIKEEIKTIIDSYQQTSAVKEFYKMVKEDRNEWRQNKLMEYVSANDAFIEKMATLAVKASVNAEFSAAIIQMLDNQMKDNFSETYRHLGTIEKAIDSLNGESND